MPGQPFAHAPDFRRKSRFPPRFVLGNEVGLYTFAPAAETFKRGSNILDPIVQGDFDLNAMKLPEAKKLVGEIADNSAFPDRGKDARVLVASWRAQKITRLHASGDFHGNTLRLFPRSIVFKDA